MPGQPWPVLGSRLATVLVACLAALAVTAAVRRLSASRTDSTRRRTAGLVGVLYAALTVGLWAVVRAVAHPASFAGYGGAIVFWVALAFAGAAVLAAGTTYAHARFGYVTAPFALFAATAFTWYVFLHVGGETDVLWVWAFLAAPALVAGTAALLAGEWAVRNGAALVENDGGGREPAA